MSNGNRTRPNLNPEEPSLAHVQLHAITGGFEVLRSLSLATWEGMSRRSLATSNFAVELEEALAKAVGLGRETWSVFGFMDLFSEIYLRFANHVGEDVLQEVDSERVLVAFLGGSDNKAAQVALGMWRAFTADKS
jgi:hypothetical protein